MKDQTEKDDRSGASCRYIEATAKGVFIRVRVQPRASRDQVAGIQGEAIKIRISAPPVEGEANDALVKFLAKQLGVPRSAVEVVRGQTGRKKTVRVAGIRASEARRALGL